MWCIGIFHFSSWSRDMILDLDKINWLKDINSQVWGVWIFPNNTGTTVRLRDIFLPFIWTLLYKIKYLMFLSLLILRCFVALTHFCFSPFLYCFCNKQFFYTDTIFYSLNDIYLVNHNLSFTISYNSTSAISNKILEIDR